MTKVIIECEICKAYQTTSADIGKSMNALQRHIITNHKTPMSKYIETYSVDSTYVDAMRKKAADANKKRLRDPKVINKNNIKLLQKMGADEYNTLPICEICGYRGKQLYKHISTIHDMKLSDYKTQYFGPTEQEEYLSYLSDSRKGSNNPMWNKGDSANSPFSKNFYIKKGYNEIESIALASEKNIENHIDREKSSYSTHIDYYVRKHICSREDAQIYYHNRQQTNSIENIAKRNNISLTEAQVIRDEITSKWLHTLSLKTPDEINEINRKKLNGMAGVSTASINFFDMLILEANLDKSKVLYKENELVLGVMVNDSIIKRYKYDFTYKRKIIEYNGDHFHANPKLYKATDTPIKRDAINKTAQEIWEYDEKKGDLAKLNGYEIMYIWHSDVKANPYKMLRLAREFLESEQI